MSKIAWTDETWNPIVGCSHAAYSLPDGAKVAHPGCDHCYAERMCSRLLPGFEQVHNVAAVGGHWTKKIVVNPARLLKPLEWKTGRRIFVCSLSDLWHPAVSHTDRVLIHAVMLWCHWHQFQDLTKRPENATEWLLANPPYAVLEQVEADSRWYLHDIETPYCCLEGAGIPIPQRWEDVTHIHRYVSVSDQATADSLIPLLLRIPAYRRGISLEPMLGPVDLKPWVGRVWTKLDHVIVGGESGPGARPCSREWIDAVVARCDRARVPCFVKQLGTVLAREQGLPGAGTDPAGYPQEICL